MATATGADVAARTKNLTAVTIRHSVCAAFGRETPRKDASRRVAAVEHT
jgi:hypothetical protein